MEFPLCFLLSCLNSSHLSMSTMVFNSSFQFHPINVSMCSPIDSCHFISFFLYFKLEPLIQSLLIWCFFIEMVHLDWISFFVYHQFIPIQSSAFFLFNWFIPIQPRVSFFNRFISIQCGCLVFCLSSGASKFKINIHNKWRIPIQSSVFSVINSWEFNLVFLLYFQTH